MTRLASEYPNKAFISYSHGGHPRLAAALHQSLERFGKRWYARRSFVVFLDSEHLRTGDALPPTLMKELESSEFLVLMASKRAVCSRWVCRELRHWLEHRAQAADHLLIALTDDEIAWDGRLSNDFDWIRTNALPRKLLQGKFRSEPVWADFRWARDESAFSLEDPRFRDAIRRLAAALHGCKPYELDLEDRRQHRRARIVRLAVWTFLALALIASGFAYRENRLASARSLAANAEAELSSDPALALHIAHHATVVSRSVAGPVPDVLRRALFESALESTIPPTAEGVGYERLAASPGGSHIAVLAANHVLHRWTLELTRDRRLLLGKEEVLGSLTSPRELRYSPDSAFLVAIDHDRLLVWDNRSQHPAVTYAGHTQAVEAVVFIPVDDRIASLDVGGALHVWRARNGQPLAHLQTPIPATSAGQGTLDLTASPDAHFLACAVGLSKAVVWRLEPNGLVHHRTLAHASPVTRAEFLGSPPGTARLALASRDGTVALWDADRGTRLADLRPHAGPIQHLHADPSSGRLLTFSAADRILRVHPPYDAHARSGTGSPVDFEVAEGDEIRGLDVSSEFIPVMNPSATRIGLASLLGGRHLVAHLRGHRTTVQDVSLVPGSLHVISGAGSPLETNRALDNTLRIWKPRLPRSILPSFLARGRMAGADFSPATGYFLGAIGTNALLAQINTPGPFYRLPHPADALPVYGVAGVALAADAPVAAVVYSRRTRPPPEMTVVYDLESMAIRRVYVGHSSNVVVSVTLSADGRVAATADHMGHVHVWSTAEDSAGTSVRARHTLQPLAPMILDSQGRHLCVIDSNSVNRVFQVGRTAPPASVQLGFAVNGAAFDPRGDAVALICADHEIRVWDFRRGRIVRSLAGHSDEVLTIAYSRDGRFLASTSADGTARLWTTATGYAFAVLPSPTRRLAGAWFTQDSREIVLLGDDGTLRSVECPECCPDDDLASLAVQRGAARILSPDERRLYLRD